MNIITYFMLPTLAVQSLLIHVWMCVYKTEDYSNGVFSCGEDNYTSQDGLLYLQ